MKALNQIALFTFFVVALCSVHAQQANEILGTNTQKVSIANYEQSYSSAVNNNQNMVLTCYINTMENYNHYFTSTVKTNTGIGQKVLQDLSNYDQESEDLNIQMFENSDLNGATHRQMHQLKRDRIVAVVNTNNKTAIISYSRDFYRQHILGK